MGSYSYVQSNFFGGRWSPNMQGRMDDPRYKTALAELCNSLPSEEGAAARRSGFENLGFTHTGAPGRLIPFKFSTSDPYLAEFTEGNLRLWDDQQLLLTADTYGFIMTSDGSTPTVFSAQQSDFSIQHLRYPTYNEGDYILIYSWDLQGLGASPQFVGSKVFQIVNVVKTLNDADFTFNLVDPVTGADLQIPSASWDDSALFRKVMVLQAPYSEDQLQQIRKVQSAGDQASQFSAGAVEQVTFFHGAVQPQSLLTTQPFSQGLVPAKFTDGPYLDQPDTQIPLQPGGTTGVINIAVIGWLASTTYALGDAVAYNDNIYISLIANNLGNTPPATIDADWALAPQAWATGTTYSEGQSALFGGVIYFSLVDINIGNEPDTNPTAWSSAVPPTWSSIETYAANAYVTYAATTYVSIVGSNLNNQPDTHPADWVAINIVLFATEVEQLLSGFVFTPGDIGRHIRLQAAPRRGYLRRLMGSARRSHTTGTSSSLSSVPTRVMSRISARPSGNFRATFQRGRGGSLLVAAGKF